MFANIAQMPGGEECKHTVVRFLYYMWSEIISLEARMWTVNNVDCEP